MVVQVFSLDVTMDSFESAVMEFYVSINLGNQDSISNDCLN